jgi:hypothetical protein
MCNVTASQKRKKQKDANKKCHHGIPSSPHTHTHTSNTHLHGLLGPRVALRLCLNTCAGVLANELASGGHQQQGGNTLHLVPANNKDEEPQQEMS